MQEILTWNWHGQGIQLGFDVRGEGPSIVMLPTLSSISNRSEMHPISNHLSSSVRAGSSRQRSDLDHHNTPRVALSDREARATYHAIDQGIHGCRADQPSRAL